VIDLAVSSLQGETPLASLDVVENGLGFDSDAPSSPADDRIPRSEVTRDPEGHLGSPTQTRVQSPSQSFQKRELGSVADGIACWICSEREVESDDRTPGAKLGNRHPLQFATFEPQELLVRSARCGTGVAETQPGPDSRQSVFLPDAAHRFAGPSASSVGRSLSRPHDRHHRRRGFTTALSADGPHTGPTNRRTTRCLNFPLAGPLAGPPSGPTGQRRARIRPRRADWVGPMAAWSASRTRHGWSAL
jgi:hypothetical protein